MVFLTRRFINASAPSQILHTLNKIEKQSALKMRVGLQSSFPQEQSLNGSRLSFSSDSPPVLSSLKSPPTSRLAPPGHCQFGEEFEAATLVDRFEVSPSSGILRFSLPDGTRPLNLSTCACILAKAKINGEEVIRPYTPISTNALTGYMDLLVKNYFDKGTMSKFLHEVPVGSDQVSFKHVSFNVKIQAPFQQKRIVMVSGGSGITPMIQALHSLLDNSAKGMPMDQKVTLLYGSQHSDDILGRSLLDEWAANHSDKFELVHVLSDEPKDSSWSGKRGMIDQPLLQQYLPSPSIGEDVVVFICGPLPMYKAICGPRDDKETVGGILGDMGFSSQQVYKF